MAFRISVSVLLLCFGFSAATGKFLRLHGSTTLNLTEVLDVIVTDGHDFRTRYIKNSISDTFEAMPKTSAGKVGPHAVQHLLQSYFRKEHGWSLDHSVQREGVLKTVPALVPVLEDHGHARGFDISETAKLAAAVEGLLIDESIDLLRSAYAMNGFEESQDLNREELYEVLLSYLVIYQLANKAVVIDPRGHYRWKEEQVRQGSLAVEVSFVMESINAFDYAQKDRTNPFLKKKYSFETTSQIVSYMAQRFGRVQDESCKLMRSVLEDFDKTGTGRIKLSDFYNVKGLFFFELNEPVSQLREIGALDETYPGRPTVRIANYMQSPSNCGRFSKYYKVCCISACDFIMNELEGTFRAHMIPPEDLLLVARNISVSVEEAGFDNVASPLLGQATGQLTRSLKAIAAGNGGMVPIHGELFAEWLHFAFPRSCPVGARGGALRSRSVEDPVKEDLRARSPQDSELDLQMPTDVLWTGQDKVEVLQDLLPPMRPFGLRDLLRNGMMVLASGAFLISSLQQCSCMWDVLGRKRGKTEQDQDAVSALPF